MIVILFIALLLSGCETTAPSTLAVPNPCNQAQLDAVTQTVKDIQMNRTINEIINMPEHL